MNKQQRLLEDLEIFLSDGKVSARSVLKMLSEHGVVIKVDRGLPVKIAGQENMHYCAGYYDACHQMLKAGWEAVELLIEENK